MARFGGVHAFGYNLAESELIWMKSWALWLRCWGLAEADFGRDPPSNDSCRARWNFLSDKQCAISPISHLPIFYKIWTQHVDRWGNENFQNQVLTTLL